MGFHILIFVAPIILILLFFVVLVLKDKKKWKFDWGFSEFVGLITIYGIAVGIIALTKVSSIHIIQEPKPILNSFNATESISSDKKEVVVTIDGYITNIGNTIATDLIFKISIKKDELIQNRLINLEYFIIPNPLEHELTPYFSPDNNLKINKKKFDFSWFGSIESEESIGLIYYEIPPLPSEKTLYTSIKIQNPWEYNKKKQKDHYLRKITIELVKCKEYKRHEILRMMFHPPEEYKIQSLDITIYRDSVNSFFIDSNN